jgi:hypothetical protein
MPRWFQVLLQALMMSCTILLAARGQISPGAALGISALQGALGVVCQSYNTDGTPQAVAFRKKNEPPRDWQI